MSIFDDITDGLEQAAEQIKSSTHWEADVHPDEPSAPITDAERAQVLEASSEGNTHAFADIAFEQRVVTPDFSQGYVPPKRRQALKEASMAPKSGLIKREEDRLFEAVARHDLGMPEELQKAVTDARNACRKAYDVLEKARHPQMPSQVRNPEAKAAALKAIDAAKTAVDHAIRVSERDDIRAEQYETVVGGIGEAQEQAAEALEVAVEAFTRWRTLITAGDALAKAQGKFGEWHRHRDERSINPQGLIGDLRRARDLVKTDDVYLSGRYLVDDPTPDGEIPAWTADALKAGIDFERTVLWRLLKLHPQDPAARESVEARNLRIILNAPIPALHPESRREEFGPVHEGFMYEQD